MARINYFEPICARIEELGAGEVFIISDFSDITDTTAVRKVLSRLEEDGKIRRIMRGMYDRPEYNDFLGEYVEPVPDKVARNFGWTISPCGDTALNMLGLSTQVPAVWLYVSDGTYKSTLLITRPYSSNAPQTKKSQKISYKTALVIQALKALGKEKITDEMVKKIKSATSKEEKSTMFSEAKYATAWIYDIIKEICGDKA